MALCFRQIGRSKGGFYTSLISSHRLREYLCFGHSATVRSNYRYGHSFGVPRLSPQEVTTILRANESIHDIKMGSVRAFDTNQLPSNNPIEDRLAMGRCLLTTGMLFGVYDGHGGHNCAEIVSKRLLDYIALSILPTHLLKEFVENCTETGSIELVESFMEVEPQGEHQVSHYTSLRSFANKLLSLQTRSSDDYMQQAMSQAFLQLDEDLSQEIQEGIAEHDLEISALAVMGVCASVAHIDGSHLHVATCGDCRAVLGMLSDDNKWTCKPLTTEHNTDNVEELKRVLSEHPKSEANVVIKNERLLGQLAPLRALGDFSYKWKVSLLKDLLVPVFGPGVIPPNYYTPPYLTALPEVIHYRLTPRDKFLVIATDGLWEQMMPHKVVKFVGQHMSGKQTLDLLKLPRKHMLLHDVNTILLQRRWGLNKKPIDTNAATHLIRNALGRTEYGIEHSKLSAMLSLPGDLVRNFRDDVSIIVVFFDSDFLRQLPAE